MINRAVLSLVKELKQASKKNKAPLWAKLANLALKPSSSMRVVNLTRIDKVTKNDDVLIVPGKVLGTGNISHKITLCSFSISTTAAKKIIKSGGKIIRSSDMIQKYPTGKGVMLIG
ncbi:50S ribosomal protein L18e [Marine Group I thaumarchaeote SCGC AAA799-O18]|nr:50S ribosomal protein L18e [Marine Group I thaumarchaeote SCGC AAA799-O18]